MGWTDAIRRVIGSGAIDVAFEVYALAVVSPGWIVACSVKCVHHDDQPVS